MRTINKQAAQGDVMFTRVNTVPKTAKLVEKFDGIVAHSETGHHHKLANLLGVQYFTTDNPQVAYLKLEAPVMIDHHRGFDTHESISFEAGTYECRRPVEYVSPSEQRLVAD